MRGLSHEPASRSHRRAFQTTRTAGQLIYRTCHVDATIYKHLQLPSQTFDLPLLSHTLHQQKAVTNSSGCAENQ
jgi:hypothetical protein